MAFGSGDYLYCSHRTCRRRFCSEGALDKHYGSFHGRPTCETCGKKLKKSGKVCLPFISPTFRQPQPTNPILRVDSIRARCWIQVPSSKITPRSTLFPTPTTLTTTTIPRMLRYVQLAPSNDTGNELIARRQLVDISSPPTFTTKDFQGIGAFSPSLNFDGFYRTQFTYSSLGSLGHDDDGSSSCTPPITDDLSGGDCDSDSCGTWEDHGGLDEYADFYDDHRCVGSDRANSLPRFSLTPSPLQI